MIPSLGERDLDLFVAVFVAAIAWGLGSWIIRKVFR